LAHGPRECLDNPNLWRERLHADDLSKIEAEIAKLFDSGKHSLEYRFRQNTGSNCWVSDEQHSIRDEKGEPVETSDVAGTARREWREASQRSLKSALVKFGPWR
jgi:PAS domain-containing protein